MTRLTMKIERGIRHEFPPDVYEKIFKKTNRLQRAGVDWYVAELAVNAARDGKRQQASQLIQKFLQEELGYE